MSAIRQTTIENFWVNTGLLIMILLSNQLSFTVGQYPLLNRNIPEDISALEAIKSLLSGSEISLTLQDSITFTR